MQSVSKHDKRKTIFKFRKSHFPSSALRASSLNVTESIGFLFKNVVIQSLSKDGKEETPQITYILIP
jgi:hypothetical protein